MKNLFFLVNIAMCLIFAACSKDSTEQNAEQALVPVTVRVSDFAVSQGDFPATRATAIGSYNGVKFLTLSFYKSDGTEVYKHTQNRDDASTYTTFGEFSTSLMYGNYTMVVVANGNSNAVTLTSATTATYGENKPWDTYAATQAVSITGNDAVNLNATLDRVCAAVAVQSTDVRPADVAKIRVTTTAGGRSFNPTTGLATVNDGVSVEITPTSAVGNTTYVGAYLFLTADEQTMDVTVETLDATDNVLFSKTITDVPLKRNRVTVLTGAIYSGTSVSTSGFQVNGECLTDNNIAF